MLISNLHSSNVIGCDWELNQSGGSMGVMECGCRGSQRVVTEGGRGIFTSGCP